MGNGFEYGIVLTLLYTTEAIVCILLFKSLFNYIIRRFRIGRVSAFMTALCAFFTGFGLQCFSAFLLRMGIFFDLQNDLYFTIVRIAWAVSHLWTTVTLYIISSLIIKQRIDLQLRRGKRDRSQSDDMNK